MNQHAIPDPIPNPETQAFWDAAREGIFTLRWCNSCNKTHWYPRAVCPHCMSSNTEWRKASGRGTIYTFSITRRANPPYAIAYVTLEEGPTMITNIVDCDFDDVMVGQKVELVFRDSVNGQAVPMFRLQR
ncbi:MAG: DNA-binding protein [Rhodospirillaceae bacterium]|nr:DNA-binding protein [Rhodospirillaceae bacterium]|tara:strand:- start:154 stop:543 length:390 start_codon:yes stop_codon:yes gene_type:complete